LVSSFLIPDVERKKIQRRLQFEERKYLEAARKTIQQSVGLAGAKLDNEAMNLQMAKAAEGQKRAASEQEERKE
jgi:RNA polymerase-interacting CarD/CdnL/TRCF family regulator